MDAELNSGAVYAPLTIQKDVPESAIHGQTHESNPACTSLQDSPTHYEGGAGAFLEQELDE